MKVLVTPRSVTRDGHLSLDGLREAGCEIVFCTAGKQPGEDELRELLPGCAGWIAGVEKITARVLDAADTLRVISRNGSGVDNIDLAAAEVRGVAVLRADGANARGVAELTIAQVFALARGTVAADAAMKRGAWERGAAGVEIDGKILGIIGCGSIGKLVARMALGCGMKILAFDPSPDAFDPGPAFRFRPFDEVVASADFLSLHCPPAPDGRPVLDASALSRMKRGAFLINTARYDVFDAAAVLAALDSCHLGAVALDAFDSEPPRDTRLPRHPRVLATPHTGGFTRESIDRTMAVAVENLRRSLLATPR